MSTTPLPSELPYTVVGGSRTRSAETRIGVSAVVLNRGGRPVRTETLVPFAECGVDEVIAVLGPSPHYEVEQLSSRVPNTRFVLLSREVTVGEQIDIAVHEARTRYVLTIWTDMNPPAISARTLERIRELDALAVVPLLRTERNETIPSVIAPAFYRSLFRTIPTQPGSEGAPTRCVYGDIGVFDKARLERLGGHDSRIRNPYWQRLDLGMRAFLWGEQIRVLPSLRVQTTRPLPADDTTPDAGYARFHLKNLGTRFVRDQGRLPLRQIVPFALRSGLGIPDAIRQFRDARAWVHENRYRFSQDARRITELWEVEE